MGTGSIPPGEVLHPSLGSPGDAVVYYPLSLSRTTAQSKSEEAAGILQEAIQVEVPPAAIQHIFAHRQWRAGMLLADAIAHGHINLADQVVLELGAGTGLPGIVSARRQDVKMTVVTDYDSPPIVSLLQRNVRANIPKSLDRVRVAGHTWGVAMDDVVELLPRAMQSQLFDVVLLADCIWDHLSHAGLLKSISSLLAKRTTSRIYMVAGLHTGRDRITSFLRRAYRAGLELTPLQLKSDCDWMITARESEEVQIATQEAQLLKDDDALRRAPELVLELGVGGGDERGVDETVWEAKQPRLDGRRRTFLHRQRAEEAQEVGGVKERNRWITMSALRWRQDML